MRGDGGLLIRIRGIAGVLVAEMSLRYWRRVARQECAGTRL